MTNPHGSSDPGDWQPATSAPGELYTPEGQIKAVGAFARGLKDPNPRRRRYRNSMIRTGLAIAGVAVLLVVAIALLDALLH